MRKVNSQEMLDEINEYIEKITKEMNELLAYDLSKPSLLRIAMFELKVAMFYYTHVKGKK